MKKRVLQISLLLLLANTGSVFAQQGFGTKQPHRSAAVDITSPNKGLLIPRMSLEALNSSTPIVNPEISLLVYNTKTLESAGLKEGYYYWTGSLWEPFTTSSTDKNTKNISFEVVNGALVLTDSDQNALQVPLADLDQQKITSFELNANHQLKITLERDGSTEVDLSSLFNSTVLHPGTNTTLSGDGTAGNPYKINVALATVDKVGVVKIGQGIEVDENGVISVPAAPNETVTFIENTIAGHKIADYKNEAGLIKDINETITKVTQDNLGISYTAENGQTQLSKVVSSDADNLLTVGADFGAHLSSNKVQEHQVKYQIINGTNTTAALDAESTPLLQKYKVNVENATSTKVGVVKPGDGLTVDAAGKLNVTFPAATVDTNTTNKSLEVVGSNLVLTDTDNAVVSVALSDLDKQQLTYDDTNHILSLERGGNGIDLSSLATDTNTITTAKAKDGQSYVTVTATPASPTAQQNREYEIGVNAATAKTSAAAGKMGVVKPNEQFEIDSEGYLKVAYSLPEFFYFPAINIPLNNVNGEVDLYGIYSTRFMNSAMPKSPSAEDVNLASFVKPANMIDIYITYYDNQVINNVNITDEGKLTYTVVPNFVLSEESYMNIVFKVRKTPRP